MAFKDNKIDPNFIFKLERNIKAYMLYVIIVLAIIISLLAGAIMFLTPLKEKQPYLVFFSNADTNFVSIKQANMDMRADENLLKSIIAGYVKKRETINRIDDVSRYEEIRIQSSSQVWTAFSNLVKQSNSVYTTSNLYRNIEIINVAILSKNVATIDFIATISIGEERESKKYRATLYYDFENLEINYDSVPKNPTGFLVSQYSITDIIDNAGAKK